MRSSAAEVHVVGYRKDRTGQHGSALFDIAPSSAYPETFDPMIQLVFNEVQCHYLPQDDMVNKLIYLVWASWVTNGTTFLSDNR